MATTRTRQRQRTLHPDHYFVRSQQPLHALVFLLPLIVLYEIGAALYAHDPDTGVRYSIRARSFLREFLELFGAAGDYLPGLAVIVVLLAWHIAQREKWKLDGRLYIAMGFESLALALPLVLFSLMVGRAAASAVSSADVDQLPLKVTLVLSIGAGIYEELVFRLAAIALFHMIVVDLLGAPHRYGAMFAIVMSALFFASYHFSEGNPFTRAKFIFYVFAGLYFAVIYVLRGFGVVAATHALFDVFIFSIKAGLWPAR